MVTEALICAARGRAEGCKSHRRLSHMRISLASKVKGLKKAVVKGCKCCLRQNISHVRLRDLSDPSSGQPDKDGLTSTPPAANRKPKTTRTTKGLRRVRRVWCRLNFLCANSHLDDFISTEDAHFHDEEVGLCIECLAEELNKDGDSTHVRPQFWIAWPSTVDAMTDSDPPSSLDGSDLEDWDRLSEDDRLSRETDGECENVDEAKMGDNRNGFHYAHFEDWDRLSGDDRLGVEIDGEDNENVEEITMRNIHNGFDDTHLEDRIRLGGEDRLRLETLQECEKIGAKTGDSNDSHLEEWDDLSEEINEECENIEVKLDAKIATNTGDLEEWDKISEEIDGECDDEEWKVSDAQSYDSLDALVGESDSGESWECI